MQANILLIITQAAGILLLLSTVVLLFSRRIYLDATTKEPITFKLPIIGEINTQAPVIVLIVIAALMVVFPISRSGPHRITIHGHVKTEGKPVTAIVVAVPDYQFNQQTDSDDCEWNIPLLATDATYRVMFIVDKQVVDDRNVKIKGGEVDLAEFRWVPPLDSAEQQISFKKDLSDAQLKAQLSN